MSELEARFVKTGLWINENYDFVHRMIITTDTQTGIIVIALLAVLSAVGTTHLWHLISFGYHQYRADGKPKDGLFRQQQALLRQSTSPTSIMVDNVKLWWSWRNRANKALARTVVPVSLSVICAVGTIAASIASSFVVDTSNLEVLVRSPFCGRPEKEYFERMPVTPYTTALWHVSSQYSQDCYPTYMEGNVTFPIRCRVFVRPSVDLPTIEMAECPFSPNICATTKDASWATVAVDSGLVDVNELFGLNLAPKERVKFRKKTTCSVLRTDEHIKVTKSANHPIEFAESICPDEEILLLQHSFQTVYISLLQTNLTYRATLRQGFFQPSSLTLSKDNRLDVPIPELRVGNGDVDMIYVLKNSLMMVNQTDDPLFSSHKKATTSFEAGAIDLYLVDEVVTPVACVRQYQFCVASSNGDICTRLNGIPYDIMELGLTGISDVQEIVIDTLRDAAVTFSAEASGELRINSRVVGDGLIDSKIPETQWITEIVNWESFLWAGFQIAISDYAIGPQLRTPEDLNMTKPTHPGQIELCNAQRMRKSGGFVNINVFGLVFTIAVSCLAAIVDITLLKFLIFVSRFRKALAPRIERWIQDGILQLQRRAYEAQGASTWTYLEKDVPVTVGKDQLPDLPVETMPPRIHSMHLELDRSWTAMTNMSSGSSLAKYSVDGPGKRLLKRSTSF